MRRSVLASLLAVALLLAAAVPSDAWQRHRGGRGHVRGHVFIGVGPAFWWGPSYPYWYYPPPYYAYPPAVIVEQPPVYTQQPPLPPAAPPQSYWYYCPSAQAYYPSVPTCPEAWVKVPPRPQ